MKYNGIVIFCGCIFCAVYNFNMPLIFLTKLFQDYPCPLVSVRHRKPVFYEIGHTIINLLADFRNFQYMLTQIRGVTIHMENKKTVISFPRNRYDEVCTTQINMENR